MEMDYIKIQEQSTKEIHDSPKHEADDTWRPGYTTQVPWAGVSALIVALVCTVASAAILVASNGQPVAAWTVQPTVLLALLTAAVNSLLHFALSEGINVTWWRKALTEGTTVNDLHHEWNFGTSVMAAIVAGRRFSLVALASIMATFVVIDAPLLQRASSITSQNITTSITMSANLATTIPETGLITGRLSYATLLLPLFAGVIHDYGNRVPINSFTGCSGTCSLTVKAFGFTPQCATSTTPINHTIFDDSAQNPDYPLFYSGIGMDSDGIILNVFYASFRPAPGIDLLTSSLCTLRPAALEYPVVSKNGTLQLQTSTSNYTVSSMIDFYDSFHGPTILGGIQMATGNLFESEASTRYGGAVSWVYSSRGLLASQYINYTEAKAASQSKISFRDPTPDILASFNEIMFRFALAAANSSTNQVVSATQVSAQNIYQSHYRYLAGAMVVMLFSIFTVTPMFYGYWHLGRKVSMSPIEISKAFDAPLLQGSGSNAKVEKLLKNVGNRRVRYGEIISSDYLQPIMGDSTVEGDSLHRRLAMMSPDRIVHPRRKVKYD